MTKINQLLIKLSFIHIILWLLLILVTTNGTAAEKYIANTKRLSTSEIAISCNNGGDPTGTKVGNTLIISCGR